MNDKYIDIHTHSYYSSPDTTILLNVFPHEADKLSLKVYKSVGLHPWHIQNTWEDHISIVEKMINSGNVIAVGEAGLDKVIKTDLVLQNNVFTRQLKIAEQHHKPLVIHCVRSYNEMVSYRKKSDQSLPWIFHWFNSDLRIAQ
ncbi:MAG TPA: TatD family hydrolase, partial [Bacteroidales bacterium]|nr:TatD family hydrolase [Bacteroidales bacterium]